MDLTKPKSCILRRQSCRPRVRVAGKRSLQPLWGADRKASRQASEQRSDFASPTGSWSKTSRQHPQAGWAKNQCDRIPGRSWSAANASCQSGLQQKSGQAKLEAGSKRPNCNCKSDHKTPEKGWIRQNKTLNGSKKAKEHNCNRSVELGREY